MAQDIFRYVDVALQSTYDGIQSKDNNTLYGIKDTQRLYFGSALVADKNVHFYASALPQSGIDGAMYIVNSGENKGLYRWNPTGGAQETGAFESIISISEFIVTSIRSSSSASDAKIPSEKAVATAIEGITTDMDWKPAVATYADIATTYPNPEEGWTVSCSDTNQIYRYDDTTTSWVNIFTLTADIVVPTGETGARNGLMSADMAAKLAGIETGAEVNQNAFSSITIGAGNVDASSSTDSFEIAGGTNISVSASGSVITIAGPNKTSEITSLDSYAIASAKAALATTDTLNQALGKLEYRVKGQEDALITSLTDAATDAQIPSAKAVYDAIKVVHM